MAGQTPKLMMYFLEHLSRICQTAQTTDLIVEPLLTGIATSSWQQLKFYPTTSVQPRFTSQVDLTVPDLMESFKPKTRYNIRLAEKKEVAISASTERTDLIEFYRLLTVTARRQNVTFYPMDYYQTLFDAFSPAGNITVMTARQGNDVLAALLLIFYQDTAYYLYGGTADLKREYMANYLLHYRAMELARDAGSAFYDFWGIAMADDPLAEKWAGITRFKLGFSGTMIEYAPAFRRIFRSFWPRLRALFNSLRSLPSLLKRRPA